MVGEFLCEQRSHPDDLPCGGAPMFTLDGEPICEACYREYIDLGDWSPDDFVTIQKRTT